ncbi:MAG: restriction endonuclease [Solirubrobacterales bacterium]
MTLIDDLHAELFSGSVPAKRGTAYERLGALVLAVLGWEDVVQDAHVTAEGKLAEHALDVTARQPTGEIEWLTLECKDWSKEVGKGTLDTLVGVRAQIGGEAAVVTTVGYTEGARSVATGEGIAMLLLRPYDPESPTTYVKRIELTINAMGSVYSEFNVEVPTEGDVPGDTQLRIDDSSELLSTDGSPAESFAELKRQHHGPPLTPGEYPQRVEFPEGRLLSLGKRNDPLPVRAVSWTETIVSSPTTVAREFAGEPKLVLQQLDENGGVREGRVVVDQELYAWEIAADGHVTRRRQLLSPTE